MSRHIKVAILGRPNVGKSTLFNRLIKARKAIIDPTPGVTRDVIKGELEINGRIVSIFDTGGLTEEGGSINDFVQQKSYLALQSADLVLFIVEAGKVLPIEEEYINIIRKNNKKAVIAMNKSDSHDKDVFLNEFYQYGLGEPIPISASHNRNIEELLDAIAANLPEVSAQDDIDEMLEEEERIKVAIVGKPNVGKSSLLNKILGEERSIVSNMAGTTRDTVDEPFEFQGKKFTILDTAGIRRKSKVNENIEYYSVNRAIKTIEQADVIFLVIDSVEDLADQDKKITDQIVKHGKGLIVLLNKWDLQVDDKETLDKKVEMVRFKFPVIEYAPVLPVSAKSGRGVKSALKRAVAIYNQLRIKITTPQLNDFIQDVIRRYSPSSKKGVLKIYYGVQSGTAPVEFIFFVNKKELISSSYAQYIKNRLRETYGFTGVPLKLIFKSKKS